MKEFSSAVFADNLTEVSEEYDLVKKYELEGGVVSVIYGHWP